jgi:hypothetical protein
MPYAIVGGALALGGAVIQGNAAQSAAQTQANAANSASQTELSMFNTTQNNLAPYMKSGTNALSALNVGLGIGPKAGGAAGVGYGSLTAPFTAADYQSSPGYAWQMGQGIDAVQNSASAAGGIGGGNTLKALTTYGQGLANTDYQQAYQNYVNQQQQRYGMLSGQAAAGQNAAVNLGGFSGQVGGQIGSNTIGAGNALAAGTVGAANAATGGINSLAQIANLYGNGGQGFGGAPTSGAYGSTNSPAPNGGTYQYDQNGNVIGVNYTSDIGTKRDLGPYLFDGQAQLGVYEFNYLDDPEDAPKRLGFIAHEAQEKYPEAVSRGAHGYLTIDYSKIPKEEDWQKLREIAEGVFA